MKARIALDKLDPADSARVGANGQGSGGRSRHPLQPAFRASRQRDRDHRVQARLLDGFRKAKTKVVYTFVAHQPGYPGASRIPRCFARLSKVDSCCRAPPRSNPSTTSPLAK